MVVIGSKYIWVISKTYIVSLSVTILTVLENGERFHLFSGCCYVGNIKKHTFQLNNEILYCFKSRRTFIMNSFLPSFVTKKISAIVIYHHSYHSLTKVSYCPSNPLCQIIYSNVQVSVASVSISLVKTAHRVVGRQLSLKASPSKWRGWLFLCFSTKSHH